MPKETIGPGEQTLKARVEELQAPESGFFIAEANVPGRQEGDDLVDQFNETDTTETQTTASETKVFYRHKIQAIENVYYDEFADTTWNGNIVVVLNKRLSKGPGKERWRINTIDMAGLPTTSGGTVGKFVTGCNHHHEVRFQFNPADQAADPRIVFWHQKLYSEFEGEHRTRVPGKFTLDLVREFPYVDPQFGKLWRPDGNVWRATIDLTLPAVEGRAEVIARPGASVLCSGRTHQEPSEQLKDADREVASPKLLSIGENGTYIAYYPKGFTQTDPNRVCVDVVEVSPFTSMNSMTVEASFDGSYWIPLHPMGRLRLPKPQAGHSGTRSAVWRFRGNPLPTIAKNFAGYFVRVRDRSGKGQIVGGPTGEHFHPRYRVAGGEPDGPGCDLNDVVAIGELKVKVLFLLDHSWSMSPNRFGAAHEALRQAYDVLKESEAQLATRIFLQKVTSETVEPTAPGGPTRYRRAEPIASVLGADRFTGWNTSDAAVTALNALLGKSDLISEGAETPLAETLANIPVDLGTIEERAMTIVFVLSDGRQSEVGTPNPPGSSVFDSDKPVAAVRKLIEDNNMPNQMHIVGIQLQGEDEKAIEKIVAADRENTGVIEFHNESNLSNLTATLKKLVETIHSPASSSIRRAECP